MTRAGESRRVAVGADGRCGVTVHWSGGRPADRLLRREGDRRSHRRRAAGRCDASMRRRRCLRTSSAGARRRSLSADASIGSVGMLTPAIVAVGWICRRTTTSMSPSSTSTRSPRSQSPAPLTVKPLPRYPSIARDISIVVDRDLARGNSSWHYPCGCAGHARLGARVRSVSRQRRARRARQPLASPHVPLSRADADRCRSGDGDDKRFWTALKNAHDAMQRINGSGGPPCPVPPQPVLSI